jgi:hypothetical protein
MADSETKKHHMQMKFRLLPILFMGLTLTFISCQKEKETKKEQPSTELSTHTEDQNIISNEMETVTNEINAELESNAHFAGRVLNQNNIICGATVTLDTLSNPRTITISYNGNNCANTHLRTGEIVVSMPAGVRWKDAGAALTVNYDDFKVKRLVDNKSITINGTQTLTNETGGLLFQLAVVGTITHSLTSSPMTITFDDSTQRTWNVSRQRDYTYNNGIVATISGTHTIAQDNQVAEWGTNRFGHAFSTSITNPLVIRQDCSFRLTGGAIRHNGFATATATFGLDANGNPTGCPGSAHYYYRLTFTGPNGGSASVILPY